MENIYIAGTGYWKADEIVTNDEIVASFNNYVERFNADNIDQINSATPKLTSRFVCGFQHQLIG